jgi:hypothetical protein
MGNLWTWLKDEANRKIVTWIAVGVGAIATYFGVFKPETKPNPPSQAVTVNGGNAVNASGNARVSIGVTDARKPQTDIPTAVSAAPPSGGQTAVSQGGNAINASGNAQVAVKP